MRSTRILRVTSSREICIFCATRQAGANGSIPSALSGQRRLLNSSSKASQSASEEQLFKPADAPAPTRRLTQAEKLRKLLEASMPKPPPQSTPGPSLHASSANSRHNDMQRNHPSRPSMSKPGLRPSQQSQRQALPQRRPPGNAVGGSGRNAGRDGVGHGFVRRTVSEPHWRNNQMQDGYAAGTGDTPGNSRYRVNLDDSGPQVGDVPPFNTSQLRRRNEPSDRAAAASQSSSTSDPRRSGPATPQRLDQAELDELLGNASNVERRTMRQYTPLSHDNSVRSQCMHCGRRDHLSTDCPTKPIPRGERPRKDAAEESNKMNNWSSEDVPRSAAQAQRGEYRRNKEGGERTRAAFVANNAPEEVLNRFEQPERRRRGNHERRSRRVMRYPDEDEDESYEVELKRQRKAERKRLQEQQAAAAPTPVSIPQYISVVNLASLLRVRVDDFVAKLEELGFEEVQTDHILNAEHAGLIAQEYNFEPVLQVENEDLFAAPALTPEEYAQLPARPPVVTIMGHVDHGKTTILDYMRSTSVAASEFGGITQHIGAFSVPLASGKKITFLDTPGHSAFETMRARGANVTDIVVLVVAADDSVMPQTVEAIKHAQNAKVPIIVAINKIDKQNADLETVKRDLGRHGIQIEDFGGDIQAVPVSGKTGQGIPDLEEAIVTLSEMLDHRADPNTKVEGWVLEGSTKKSGKVATVLVRSGTLRVGDILVAGTTWTRVRTLKNESGIAVEEVGPGMPVEVDGWREQPIAGDEVLQAVDEQQGQTVAETRAERIEREQMAKDMDAINESRRLEAERREAEKAAASPTADNKSTTYQTSTGPDVVSFIVKGDVSGSVEAVIDSISAIGNAEISTRVLRHGVGAPSEFDIQHAAAANGHIINFNTAIPSHISQLAEANGVRIFDENIIYRVVENVKAMLEARLPPRITQKVTGELDIAVVFEIGLGGKKKMRVAGSKVRNGVVVKGTKAKVLRKGEVVYDGSISSLKNHKKDVQEMRKDSECGIAFERWDDFVEGDKVQCYEEESHKRTL